MLQTKSSITMQIEQIEKMHADFKLWGEPLNALLDVPHVLLGYVIALLYDESPTVPEAAPDIWEELINQLNMHYLLPLLYWKIRHASKRSRPPTAVFDKLRYAFMFNVHRLMKAESQLKEIVNAFRCEKVRLLVMKGPAMSWSAYPDPALRSFSDLDLLVPPEQFVHARAILAGLGYKCKRKIFDVFQDAACNEELVPPSDKRAYLGIDLHWIAHVSYGNRMRVETETLFRNARSIQIGDVKTEMMHPVDALIYASQHLILTHSQVIRLDWIYEIAQLAKMLEVPSDWFELQQKSIGRGACLAVEKAFKMSQLWTGLVLPEQFNDFSRWPSPDKAETTVLNDALQRRVNPVVFVKLYLGNVRNAASFLKAFFNLVFPSQEYMRHRYQITNERYLFVYFRRWGVWAIKCMRWLLKR
ncbi:nucleotidyltransferase family protein [Desulfococcaceae bacterium HSG7]|nr:nucleotidyltransferase family protein [Desulfococcaceae bacterium HSG7]